MNDQISRGVILPIAMRYLAEHSYDGKPHSASDIADVFGSPVTSFSNAQFARLSSQSNAPRQLQFAAKLLF